tara:strand:- start:96 stop:788 length:693 start_codon:yes stop_codon:yes gene_type:complete
MKNKLIDHIESRPWRETEFEYTTKQGVKANTVYCVPKNKSTFNDMITNIANSLDRFDELALGKKVALQRLVDAPLNRFPYRWQKTNWDRVMKHTDGNLSSAGSKLYPGNPTQALGQVAAGLRRAMRRILNEGKNISEPEMDLINVWCQSLEDYFYANNNPANEPPIEEWTNIDRLYSRGKTNAVEIRIKQWDTMFDLVDKMRIRPINIGKKFYDEQNQKLESTGLFESTK